MEHNILSLKSVIVNDGIRNKKNIWVPAMYSYVFGKLSLLLLLVQGSICFLKSKG